MGCYEWIPEDRLNGWGDPAAYLKRTAPAERLFTTFYTMSRGWPHCVWPRFTKDMVDEEEVEVEVQLNIVGSSAVRSACRYYFFRSDVFWLISLVIAPLELPKEVALALVPVEELNCSSSPASMLPMALSEVLGISLDEVMRLYFDRSEESI
jgi:hypothetical protein